MQYNDSYTSNVYSFCNNINTGDGGTHEEGFRLALTRTINQYAKANKFIKENDFVMVKSYKGSAFSVECENFVELLVTEAEPSVAGNTATNATKIVKLETGISIQVPMFVNEGDVIRIDTRTGDYMERVKK